MTDLPYVAHWPSHCFGVAGKGDGYRRVLYSKIGSSRRSPSTSLVLVPIRFAPIRR